MRRSDRIVLLTIIVLLLLTSLFELRVVLDWLRLPGHPPMDEAVGTVFLAFSAGVLGWFVWVFPGRDR